MGKAKDTVKCIVCGEQVPRTELFVQEYTNKNQKPSSKRGHEMCIKRWFKDYAEWQVLEQMLKTVMEIPVLPPVICKRLREFRQDYSYDIMIKTVSQCSDIISTNLDKSPFYTLAIIKNTAPQIYQQEKRKNERYVSEKAQTDFTLLDMSKGKKLNTNDYSHILDD